MIRIAAVTGFILCFGAALNAGSVTYNYTGDDFTNYGGADNSGAQTNITVSITLASALGDNFGESAVTPSSFQISDGSTTFTNLSSNIDNAGSFFDLATDGSGNIDEWVVAVAQTNDSGFLQLVTQGPGENDDSTDCGTGVVESYCSSVTGYAYIDYAGDGGTLTQPGWTETAAAPEPSTTSLVIIGAFLVLTGRSLKSRSGLSR
jgi:hypothetical protein